MATLQFQAFLGEVPRVSPELLPDMAAQQAENIDLLSGEVRPIHENTIAYAPAGDAVYQAAYRALHGGVEKWRTWAADVDIAKGPFNVDVEPRYYWTGDGAPKYATFTDFGTTDHALGIPPPGTAPGASVSGGTGTVVNRAYCYTYYRAATGEESAPSAPSELAQGASDGTWAITTGTGTTTAYSGAAWDWSGITCRLYRTSGSAGKFQLVAEIALGAAYSDTLSDAAILGDELISQTWLPPPAGLSGLTALPNGSLCGFVGTLLCFSEPYQPHAWPVEYQYGTDYPIVGIASYGTTVVAATAFVPYVVTGSDPSAMAVERIDNPWPCIAKRSVISVGDGVLYSTNDGLAYIGNSGASVFTKALFTRTDWMPLTSAEMSCAFVDQRIYVMCRPAANNLVMLVISPGEAATLTRCVESARSLFVDPNTGALYLVGKTVDLWNDAAAPLRTYNWLSKPITIPDPTNFGAASVSFAYGSSSTAFTLSQAAYAASIQANVDALVDKFKVGANNSDEVNVVPTGGSHVLPPMHLAEHLSVTFYFDDQPVTVPVFDDKPFRLPSGYKARKLLVRLAGNVMVKNVKIAETMLGLQAI